MESSSSSWTVPSLYLLLSFDYPKLSLVKCDKTSSSSSPPRRGRRSNSSNTRNQGPSALPCRICTHPSHDNQVLNEGADLLASLLLKGTADDDDSEEGGWTLCPFCLSLVRRLLRLTEEVEDIKARTKAVIKLGSQSGSLPPALGKPSHSLSESFLHFVPPSSEVGGSDGGHHGNLQDIILALKEEPQQGPHPLRVEKEEEEDDHVSTPSSDPDPNEEEEDGVSSSVSIEGPFTIPAVQMQKTSGGRAHRRAKVIDPDLKPLPPRRPRGRPRRHLPMKKSQNHHHQGPCYFCGKTLSRSDRNIEFHIRIHTRERPFLCSKCGVDLRFYAPWRRNVASNCGQVDVQRPPKVEEDHHQEPRQEGKVQCHLCGTLLASSRQLDGHMKVRHEALKVSFPIEGKSSGFHCPKCVRTYVRQRSLVHHMKINHLLDPTERQFCPICNQYFRSKDGLAAHTHLDPNNDPAKVLYICPICSKTFPTSEKYARHRHHVHTKSGTQCPTCGKVFRQDKTLVAHARTCSISSEVQATCSVVGCGKTFGFLAERIDHERVVHKGLSSTRCYFCSKVSSTTERLQEHMRVHTLEAPYRCTECGRDFRWTESFRIHKALVCGRDEGKKEKERARKREEMRAFRAKRKYSCDFCDKRFGHKPQLGTHKRREHFM